jgi:hypothetical protein
VTPAISLGIVLVKEMVFAIEEDESIGVVDEVLGRRKVEERPGCVELVRSRCGEVREVDQDQR